MNQTPTKIKPLQYINKSGVGESDPYNISSPCKRAALPFDISFFRCYMSLLILICHGDIRLAIHPPASSGYFPCD